MTEPLVRVTRMVELYENERYSPLTGWSSRGLLLTDRSAYSTKDGSGSWSSVEEASRALLPTGWMWSEGSEWKLTAGSSNIDESGWSYATDFGSIDESPSGTKTMVHFVRRRRQIRSMTYRPISLCKGLQWTCDYCDLDEKARLSKLFLNALVAASITQFPRNLTEAKLLSLKSELVESLELGGEAMGIENIEDVLSKFASEGTSSFSMVFGGPSSGETQVLFQNRMSEFNLSYFRSDEREALVDVFIRKHDAAFHAHCKVPHCSSTGTTTGMPPCPFSPATCPNDDCGVVYSLKWAAKHDSVCPHKIVECDRVCGDTMKRKDVVSHLQNACVLRPVQCPFSDMGCLTELVHRTLPEHMETCTQSHLLICATRIQEQQNVIISLNRKINDLEKKTGQHVTQIATLVTSVAAATVAVEASEKKLAKSFQYDLQKLDQKATKKSNDITTELRSEVSKLGRTVQELTAREQERTKNERTAAAAAAAGRK